MTGVFLFACLVVFFLLGFLGAFFFLRCHHSEDGNFCLIFSIMQPIAKQGLNSIIMKA